MSRNQTGDDKKPYETPELTKLGGVEEITKGNVGAVPDITVTGSR